MAFPQEWHYYAPIVIQNGQVSGGPHTNFPVYLQEECLPDVMLTTGDAQASLASGADIRFTSDEDGTTELAFHIVEYTQNAVPANASVNLWVKVPSVVNGADTTIYIWWGNPAASAYGVSDTYGQYNVWTPYGYRWMLDDDQDATINNKDLTDANVTFGAAQIDNGMEFDADGSESVTFSWGGGSDPTFQFWLKVDAARVTGERVLYAYPFEIYIDDPNPNKFRLFFKSHWSSTDGIWNIDAEYDTGVWIHFHIGYEAGASGTAADPVFTVNGVAIGGAYTESSTPAGTIDSLTATGYLGKSATGDRLHGDIDEFFIQSSTESSARGITFYNNQNAPTTFSIEGTVETFYHAQILPENLLRPYQDVDPLISQSIRAYQDVDPLVSFSIRAIQNGQLIPSFSIGGYQGSDTVPFLKPEYDILTKSGYRITSVDTTTLVETELGFIDHEASPLTLSGITLADGTYDIRIYLQGFLWLDARLVDTIRVTVSGGVVSTQLPPPVENLVYEQIATYTRFIWTWSQTFGVSDPDSFGVWISTAAPPSTAGTPDYLITAETPRNYGISHEQGYTDTLWVAVAAITGTTRGPESRVTALAPLSAPSSPTAQRADDDELL